MNKRKLLVKAADLFCGGGGTSEGIKRACQELGLSLELTAINHWDVAIATHEKNHPNVRHLCANLDAVDPRKLYKPGQLLVMWASPECMHHSIARGGKPINDQSRATAHCVCRWAEALMPRVILVENVKEFLTWGPIGANGRPLKSKRGATFRAWVAMLESLGYRVDWRLLCAANYGDPTSRERLFIQAVRGRTRIVWPEPTHAPAAEKDMFSHRKAWEPASKIIDWTNPGKSIFNRKRPLSEKTIRRIFIGLQKFCGLPIIVPNEGFYRGNSPQPVSKPLGTVTTKPHRFSLAQAFLVQVAHGNGSDKDGDQRRVQSIDQPLPTVCGKRGEFAICESFILPKHRGHSAPRKTNKPLPTVTAGGAPALVNAFIVPQQQGFDGKLVDPITRPLRTITGTSRGMGICQPFIIAIDHHGGNSDQVRSVNEPLSTATTKKRHCLVDPFILKYYETGICQPVDKPLDTVTTKQRFALVQPTLQSTDGRKFKLEVLFRMLQPPELAGAQGFPPKYKFTGNKTEIVRQIGNAVPINLSKAIVKAVLKEVMG